MDITIALITSFISLIGLKLCDVEKGTPDEFAAKSGYWCTNPFCRVIYGIVQLVGVIFVLGMTAYLSITEHWWYVLIYIGGLIISVIISIILQLIFHPIFQRIGRGIFNELQGRRIVGTIVILVGILSFLIFVSPSAAKVSESYKIDGTSVSKDSLSYIVGEFFGDEFYQNYHDSLFFSNQIFDTQKFLESIDTLVNKRDIPGFLGGVYILDETINFCKEFYDKYDCSLSTHKIESKIIEYVKQGRGAQLSAAQHKKKIFYYVGKDREEIVRDSSEIADLFARYLAHDASQYVKNINERTLNGIELGRSFLDECYTKKDSIRGFYKMIAINILLNIDMMNHVFGRNYFHQQYKGFYHAVKYGHIADYEEKNKLLENFIDGRKDPEPEHSYLLVP